MAASSEPGSLEQAAIERKKRLHSLSKKSQISDGEKKFALDSGETLPTPVFRSYKPQDKDLQQNAQNETPNTVDLKDHVAEQLAAAVQEPLLEDVDLTNLAPRKADWDLKRDVSKKLEKLERRTQRALAEITHERLSGGNVDLVTAVGAATMASDGDG